MRAVAGAPQYAVQFIDQGHPGVGGGLVLQQRAAFKRGRRAPAVYP